MPEKAETTTDVPAVEHEALNKTQKLAALLVMIGPEGAAEMLKQFQPREIEAISREMARFGMITQEQQEEILREFSEVALAASTSISAGLDVTRNMLEKALGNFKASDILGRVTPNRVSASALQTIADMDARSIFNLIRDEQPQTVAFVISHLSPEKAAQVFGLIRPEQRGAIIERLATLAPTPVEAAEKVVNVLNTKMGVKQTRVLSQTGGVTPAADILNAMDKSISRTLLASLEQGNPDLFQAIRKKMFTFEDLLVLSPQFIQRIMREIETRDLALALKKASEPLKKLLLSNISRRAAEGVLDEIAAMGHVKLRDVEAAQLRIIDAVRKLEAEGEIDLDEARNAEYEMV
ncbi:MAG TPA: flagellar motor switch protein FliG [Candidatus Saccharimonadales bacterium]|nr:flagellar motor switch protein FliG [Candidatus Saccharimonadales bacterium]